MELKPGYNQTEFGVLPNDWTFRRLGDHVTFLSHGTNSRDELRLDGPVKYLHYGDIHACTLAILEPSSLPSLPEEKAKGLDRLRDGDLVFADASEDLTGVSKSVEIYGVGSTELVAGLHTIAARFDNDILTDGFKAYLQFCPVFASQLRRLAAGTKVYATNRSHIASVEMRLPSIDEQSAIATALSDMDALLEGLDRLIAKKRDLKQATMQQLLTGKTRLPGFSGEWKKKRLGELGDFSKGQGIRREDVSDEGLPCIRYGELYTRYENYILNAESRIPPSVALESLPINRGDLLFAGSGETAEDIGRCAVYLGQETAYAGGDIIVLRPSEQSSIYLGYLMNYSTVSRQKVRMGQGDAVVHISASNLAQIRIKLPLLVEQRAIATVLYDMDAEIAALELHRNKTRAIKQSMMQVLLTGKVRLVKPNHDKEGLTC